MGRPERELGLMRIGPYLVPLPLALQWIDKLKAEKRGQQEWLIQQMKQYVGGK